jgi:hypothetical protein
MVEGALGLLRIAVALLSHLFQFPFPHCTVAPSLLNLNPRVFYEPGNWYVRISSASFA